MRADARKLKQVKYDPPKRAAKSTSLMFSRIKREILLKTPSDFAGPICSLNSGNESMSMKTSANESLVLLDLTSSLSRMILNRPWS